MGMMGQDYKSELEKMVRKYGGQLVEFYLGVL